MWDSCTDPLLPTRLLSTVADWTSTIFPHMMWPYSATLEYRSAMCCMRLAENTGRKSSPCAHHRTTLSGYMFTTKACVDSRKNLLNRNISSACPHNMVNFGTPTAETGWRVWGTPANFNGFCVLALLLHQRRSTEVNQALHDVRPFPGVVHYINYIFGGSCLLTEFCQVQNSLCVQGLRYCTALEQWASAKLWRSAEVATYIWQSGHHVGHRPTF